MVDAVMFPTPKDILAIDGLTVIPLRQLVDERGAVLHMLRADAADFKSFGECYFSEINSGVIKGWKRHRLQTQNIAVPYGRVRFVLFDDREQSRTKGQIDVVELGRPDAYARLRISPMIWYGFMCVAHQSSLVANCVDVPHDPADSDVLALDAPERAGALELLRHGRLRF